MILGIYASQMLMLMFPHIHNEIPQFLTTFELQLGSGLNSTNDSLALLGEQLSSMTALSCTLLAQTFRSSPDNVPQPHQPWSPVFATVSGSQSILMAGLVVQTLPLILGIVTCLILIFVFVASARPSTSSNNVLQDGQVINMVSILHNSSLPTVIPNSNEDLQRIQAMHTHVLYDGLTLDVDYIQERHHIPSPGIPLITLEGGNPQDEHLANRESMQASPSRPLDPGSHQPSQSQERRHWLFAGPQPYVIAYGVTITLLAAFYLFLIGLWSHHAFDHTLFNISRLGQVNQIVSVLSQAWAVATISVITFTVQAIASDLAIQQRQTVAALHDTLSSWLGVVYAVVALFQSQDHLQTRLRLVLTLVFFVSMTILHISTPSVITVHAINSTVPFNASVVRMPGNLTPIPVSIQTLANLQIVLPSISYLWNHRNSGISLPTGYNGTWVF
ncbi:hypothetical protein BS47DRAFT_1127892 [Hydnum rufescens UP504]|uniref:Uncharacterized protein n=1 Tax=Hydnum rufescens UP504 TaxID=1448309 RepID=A0A9P6AU24_9AGAM|nr:hypothetical protein BS47DRAFT_1127892 [Hydnum rufescens UP504]